MQLERLFLLPFLVHWTYAGVQMDDSGTSGTIDFGPPNLSDEETESQHMPEQLKCDGCQVIAYMLSEAFKKAESKRPSSSKKLPESEVLEVVDEVCYSKFTEYGITEVKGVKRLKGPGLDTAKTPGISQSGGKWPLRLHQMCTEYTGELGEEEVYEIFRKESGKAQPLVQFLCFDSGSMAHCKRKKRSQEL